jgi:acyl-CoA synthetase (AMP-forming)/AMP-acid ligase II
MRNSFFATVGQASQPSPNTGHLAMPLFHTAGSIMSVLGCLNSRSTLILPLLFEPGTILDAIEGYRADIIFGVPTMLLAIIDVQTASPRDISSLRIALSGGAQVPPVLHRRVDDALGRF